MDMPSNSAVEELIGASKLNIWNSLTESIESLYDMDKLWNKGFGDWIYEYKYRRGGKTLCTFYAKQDTANILIIFGKAEREKFEAQRNNFSEQILAIYDTTQTYHDGKWLWIPIDDTLSFDDILNMLKIKRKPNRSLKCEE
ncbi:MAG: DUF3788 domain-containing protein [Oscillospiraceae bacterium]